MASNKIAVIIIVSIFAIGMAGFFLINSHPTPAAKVTDTPKQSVVQQSVLSKPVQIIGNYYKFSSEPYGKNGKVRVLFIGAEFCPFCAAQRWPVVESLKNFGEFSYLSETRSATVQGGEASDIATYNFVGIDYKSNYVIFDHKETGDREYNELERLTQEEQNSFSRYNPRGSIPFLMIAGDKGIFVQVGSGYSPGTLSRLSFSELKSDLDNNKNTRATQSINNEANVITAFICYNNNNQPENVCNEENIHQHVSMLYAMDTVK